MLRYCIHNQTPDGVTDETLIIGFQYDISGDAKCMDDKIFVTATINGEDQSRPAHWFSKSPPKGSRFMYASDITRLGAMLKSGAARIIGETYKPDRRWIVQIVGQVDCFTVPFTRRPGWRQFYRRVPRP